MNETKTLILFGRAQERIRQIMEHLESKNCSKHDPFWDVEGEAGDKLDEVRRHLALLYEQMSELHNIMWYDDE